MIDDRNTFSPAPTLALVVDAARKLDEAARAADAQLSTAEALARALGLLDQLQEQRTRIAVELVALRAADSGVIGIGQSANVESSANFLSELDDFVGGVFARVEAKAKNPALTELERNRAAVLLHNATGNILTAARRFSPFGELQANAVETIRGMVDDARKLADDGLEVGTIILIVVALVAVALLVHDLRG